MTPLEQKLAEIKARMEKATPEVWLGPEFNDYYQTEDEVIENQGRDHQFSAFVEKPDLDLAKTDIALLLKEREILLGALEEYDKNPHPTDQICCGYGVQVGEQEWSCCNEPITLARQALKDAEKVWCGS